MTKHHTIGLPDDISRALARCAADRAFSAEAYLATLATDWVKAHEHASYFAECAGRSKPDAGKSVFGPNPERGQAPRPGDEVS